MIIGRNTEVKMLDELIGTNKAEFMALYGRRRIGKTFLIREYCLNKNHLVYFETTGIKDGNMKKQLASFTKSFANAFFNDAPIKEPLSWNEAFTNLTDEIKKIPNKKIILFFDELPWLATRRSGLIQYLDYYWNRHWIKIPNLKIIVCGSAASWILKNLINAKGGLHNRLTKIMLLRPFNLNDTKLFLKKKNIRLTNQQILDLYFITGGVPFYLEQLQAKKSIAQNIQAMCFSENGILFNEFPRLFKSLFENAEVCLRIIKTIATKRYGITREELLHKIKIKSGGWINDRIEELEAAGFIKGFLPFGKKKDIYYRIVDEFSFFYLKWVEPEIARGFEFSRSYWNDTVRSPEYRAWVGYSFESVCLKHHEQIKNALGLQNIKCNAALWRFIPSKNSQLSGAQIDLLFDREDNAISLCEIKYLANGKFKIDKSVAKSLVNKIEVFERENKTKKEIFLVLITTEGIEHNLYADDLKCEEVNLGQLFND